MDGLDPSAFRSYNLPLNLSSVGMHLLGPASVTFLHQ